MADGLRLDLAMVERGLARSRNHAQQLVRSGSVLVDGRVVTRPSSPTPAAATVELSGEGAATAGWVGRGALKLVAALAEHPEVARAVRGGRCLDIGASTGGFTQVLLENGAREVVALDVGHDQLDPALRADARVIDRSGTNVRDATPGRLGRFDVVVCDVSFISLTLVAPVLRPLLLPLGHVVTLIKPQFEVGRERIGDGVVLRSDYRADALVKVTASMQDAGLTVRGLDPSPVLGAHGNHEFLLWLRVASAPGVSLEGAVLDRAIQAVSAGPTG